MIKTELQNMVDDIISGMDVSACESISLTKGYVAIIDSKYFDQISNYRWHTITSSPIHVYARSSQVVPGEYVTLHNYVMSLYLHGTYDPEIKQVTFNNKITLDCLILNLLNNHGRQAAMRNRRGKSGASSKFKGVKKTITKNGHVTWQSSIMDGEKRFNLGSYPSENYAAEIYDAAAWILFGASAFYNFPIGTPNSQQRRTASARIEKRLVQLGGQPLTNYDRMELGLEFLTDEDLIRFGID